MENTHNHDPSPTRAGLPAYWATSPSNTFARLVSENAESKDGSDPVPPWDAWGTDALIRVEDSLESPGQPTVIDLFGIPRREGPSTLPALGSVPAEPNTVLPSIRELPPKLPPIHELPSKLPPIRELLSIREVLSPTPTPMPLLPLPQRDGYETTATGSNLPLVSASTPDPRFPPNIPKVPALHRPFARGPSPDITPSLAPFTDSGYASSKGGPLDQSKVSDRASHEEVKGVLSGATVVEGSLSIPDSTDGAGDSGVTDNASVYTSNDSVASETREAYAEIFMDDLIESVLDCPMSLENANEISDALPELLKHFALSLGYCPPSQRHRDVMVFIRKHRDDIARRFKEKMLTHDQRERPEQDEDNMPLNELMDRWYTEEDTTYSEVPEPSPGTTDFGCTDIAPDGMSEARSNTEMSWSIRCISEDGLASCGSSPEGPPERGVSLPGIGAYQRLIKESAGYASLLANLRREHLLSASHPNTMETIRKTILASLPTSPLVSRAQCTESLHMNYYLRWNFFDFYAGQGYGVDVALALENAICLTGSSTYSQGLTCREYVLQTWPSIGSSVLELLGRELSYGQNSILTLPDRSTIQVIRPWLSELYVSVVGPTYCIVEVGEILAWLGATLQCSPHPEGVVHRIPLVSEIRHSSGGSNRMQCVLGFSDAWQGNSYDDSSMGGQCWHELFYNPVLVLGYPISRRQQDMPGLELPLDIMAELAQTRYLNAFAGKLTLKGFSTLLVPTAASDTLITWHLLHNPDGSRISYLQSTAIPVVPATVSHLERCRHVLGWCPEMRLYAGASDAIYTLKGSKLPRAYESAPVSFGKALSIRASICVGIKDRRVHASQGCYFQKLKWLRSQFVVLWDEEDKRGWLVNAPSALLHLVRSYLHQDLHDEFHVVSSFHPSLLREAKEPYKSNSALQVLLDKQNLVLPVYPGGEGHTTVRHLAEYFCDMLEKLIDQQQLVSTGDGGTPIASRASLQGWDFADMVNQRSPIYLRSSNLSPYGKTWLDFTRSINAVTLFGRSFGEIIKPTQVCSQWATLPQQISYLAVSRADLDKIMEADWDESSAPVRLSHQLSWFIPNALAGECQCRGASDAAHCDLAQVILPTAICERFPSSSLDKYSKDGAVFFGYNSNYRWLWPGIGDPSPDMSVQAPSTRKRPLSPSIDSGIGSSSGTASLNSQGRDAMGSITPSTPSLTSEVERLPKRICNRSGPQKLTAPSYTVGIICALSLERDAVVALLDPPHDEIPIPNGDTNYYKFGSVGKHLVVTTCLPEGKYGTVPAAVAISHMTRSFRNLKSVLLVGIGGGIPLDKHDIRLGDVVVSTPSGSCSGIVPYDVKKALPGGESQQNTHLPSPPDHILSALSSMNRRLRETPPLEDYLQRIAGTDRVYRRPDSSSDRLFKSNFTHHIIYDTCTGSCPASREVVRSPRDSTQPTIHYGAIASGNQLMRDAVERDRLGKKHGVLCFETEAAGIMSSVPSLVIRGICDYADSHKNKIWQGYAAATAAAYAAFLLLHVRSPLEESDPPNHDTPYRHAR